MNNKRFRYLVDVWEDDGFWFADIQAGDKQSGFSGATSELQCYQNIAVIIARLNGVPFTWYERLWAKFARLNKK